MKSRPIAKPKPSTGRRPNVCDPAIRKYESSSTTKKTPAATVSLVIELLRTSGGTAEDLAAKGLVHGGKLPGSGKDRMKEHE